PHRLVGGVVKSVLGALFDALDGARIVSRLGALLAAVSVRHPTGPGSVHRGGRDHGGNPESNRENQNPCDEFLHLTPPFVPYANPAESGRQIIYGENVNGG